MALRVWLPLNESLENIGISDVIVTNTNGVIDNNGKIGKCYTFGTGTSYLTIPKEAMTEFSTECSVSFWLKIISWNTNYATFFQAGLGSTAWNNYIFGFLRNNANSTICFTISNGSTASNASYLTSTMELNRWYHIALTYSTGKCSIYLDGALDHEYTTTIVPAFSSITTITTGICNNKSSYQTNCSMNDLRIYDHCLSAKEVKEVAQGLVLHYKLDDPDIQTTTNFLSENQSCAKETSISLGQYVGSLSPSTCTCGNKVITFSAYIKNTSSVSVAIRCSPLLVAGSYGSYTGNYLKPGEEGWSSVTCDITDAEIYTGEVYVYFQNGSAGTTPEYPSIKVFHAQLEEGRSRSSWTLGGTTRTGRVVDSSGYNRYGIVTGTPVVSSNEYLSRYENGTYFDGSSYLKNYFNGKCLESEFTMGAWVYLPTKSSGNKQILAFSTNSGWGNVRCTMLYRTASDQVIFSVSDGTNYVGYNCNATITENAWNHCIVTYKNNLLTLYVNGVSKKTYTTTYNPKLDDVSGFAIGAAYNGAEKFTGKIADTRIYSTALSTDDVLELYHTSANIDNCGNFHGFEFVEEKPEDSVYQNGQVSTSNKKEYLVNNFTDTNTMDDWTFGGTSSISGGKITLSNGGNYGPSIASSTFDVGPDDIIVFEGTVALPTVSTTTGGPGLFLGTKYGQSTSTYYYSFSTNVWQLSNSSATNPYFINSYNKTSNYYFKTYILGKNLGLDDIPTPDSNQTNLSLYAIKLNSEESTNIRSGYNANSSDMVITLYNFKIYKYGYFNYGFIEDNNIVSMKPGCIYENTIIEK